MKTRETTPGKTYSVHTSSGCTVSDKNGWSKTIDAPDGYFTAHAGEVTIDGDDAADVREVFKLAPYQKLRLLGVVGGNVDGLPAGYKRVEYLESTGSQVIDSGLKVDSYNQEIQFKLTGEGDETRNIHALGTWDSSPELCYLFKLYKGSNSAWQASFNGYWGEKYNRPLTAPTEIKVKTTKEKQSILCINGSCESIEGRLFSLSLWERNNVALFGLCRNNNFSPDWIGRIYYVTFIKEGNIIGDFVPCLDPTGAPCMFDLVSKQPCYNSGAGDFLYPTESTTYSLRRVLPDWGKLTEQGLRRLYHAPANYQGELYDYALEHGYKPIVETEKPEEGYWSPRWTETEEEIVLEWVETEPLPDELGLPEEDLTETEQP